MNIKKLIKNKKGFTLIEIIVVIVILAVLMAVAVPSVISYINEADNAKVMANGRSVMNAAQAEVVKEIVSSDGLTADELTAITANETGSIAKNSGVSKVTNIILYTSVGSVDEATGLPKTSVTVSDFMKDTANKDKKPELKAVSALIDGKQMTAVLNDKVYVKK